MKVKLPIFFPLQTRTEIHKTMTSAPNPQPLTQADLDQPSTRAKEGRTKTLFSGECKTKTVKILQQKISQTKKRCSQSQWHSGSIFQNGPYHALDRGLKKVKNIFNISSKYSFIYHLPNYK